ncbi:Leucyl aminopeptidase (aminopeptidase T), partial [Candidatus Methanophagaceae archaeon]
MKVANSNYAAVMISDCLGIQPGEEVIIVTDKDKLAITEDLAYFIKESGGNVSVFYIPENIRPVERITDIHAVSLISADVVIYVLETESNEINMSKETAFRHYLFTLPIQYKGRVCMMPGFSDQMKDAVSVDYSRIKEKCQYLQDILANKTIRLETDLGTDIGFSLQGREIEVDTGDITKPGIFGNIPAGEIFTAPVEDTINGKIVIDGSIGGLGKLKHPFYIELESGKIKDLQPIREKDELVDKFKEICELDVPATKTVGEFGIGLNPGAKIIGTMLMDEKVEGTVHFAFGDSYGLGKSSSKFHTDLLIKNPSIFVDDKCIMEKGT